MNCPKCNKNIDGNYTFCPHCGETLGPDVILDRDFLFEETETETVASQRNNHHFRRKNGSKIYLIANGVLIACIGAIAFWVLTHQSKILTPLYTSSPEATQTTVTPAMQAAAAVEATKATSSRSTTAPTTIAVSTAPVTTAPTTTVPVTTTPVTTSPATTAAATTVAPTRSSSGSNTSYYDYGNGSRNGGYTTQTVYFDNNAYNWSQVTCYIYTTVTTGNGTSTPVLVASTPMTRGTNNVYAYTIPNGLTNAQCVFAEHDSSTDRRIPPADKAALPLNGKSMILKADSVWEEYGHTPATGPVVPTELTDPTPIAPTELTDPIIPTELTEPTEPTELTEPTEPTEPTKPTEPTQPTEPTKPTEPPIKVLVGDVDLDGRVAIKDATLIQMYLASMYDFTDEALLAADVNQDKVVNIHDITMLQHYLAGFSDTGNYCGTYTDGTEPPTTHSSESTGSALPVAEGNYFFFKNTDGWDKVYAHMWNSSTYESTEWYVKQMINLGNGVWYVETSDSYNMVVFNNGDLLQTKDTFLPGAGWIYDNGNWSRYVDTTVPSVTSPATEPTTVPSSDSVTLDPGVYNTGDEVWFAWTWGKDSGKWVMGEQDDSGYVFHDVDESIIFVRMNSDDADWSNVWDQTDGLTTQLGGTYTLKEWDNGARMNGSW